MQRYFDPILDARVVVSLERNRYNAEASITANGTPLTSHAVADSDGLAVEEALDKLEVQLRKHKDRMTRQRRQAQPLQVAASDEPEEEIVPFDESDLHGLVSEDPMDFHLTMELAEGVAQLRVSKREALGFTNKNTGRPVVLFKRKDGNIGVVDVYLD